MNTTEQRDYAIRLLAKWVCAIDRNGTSWDDWDEHYKTAKWRDNPIRELLDTAIARVREEHNMNDEGDDDE